MDNETYNAIHNDIFKAFEASFRMGQSVARENFSDIEKALCRGKRTAIENFIDWLNVCEKTAQKDIDGGVDVKLVLDTTLNAMRTMRDDESKVAAPAWAYRFIRAEFSRKPIQNV